MFCVKWKTKNSLMKWNAILFCVKWNTIKFCVKWNTIKFCVKWNTRNFLMKWNTRNFRVKWNTIRSTGYHQGIISSLVWINVPWLVWLVARKTLVPLQGLSTDRSEVVIYLRWGVPIFVIKILFLWRTVSESIYQVRRNPYFLQDKKTVGRIVIILVSSEVLT